MQHPANAPTSVNWPTVLHVTHWKAGSQWLLKILYDCAPERVILAKRGAVQFLEAPVRSGMIYPTLYVTKEEFDSVTLPSTSRHFVVIRDFRDALVSLYFSMKVSHVVDHPIILERRSKLNELSLEQGLIWLIENPIVGKAAAIQRSWLQSEQRLVRYEDLIERDEEILEHVLLRHCGIPVDRWRLREIIHAHRFERLTGGRMRGTEDVSSHERKGIAGDWKNHFTDRVKQLFKKQFGNLVLEAGYENDPDW